MYGWGIVAPRSPDVDAFERNLVQAESWLSPFDGFGPDPFLVGRPEFEFEAYRDWVEERFPPNRFRQLTTKMDPITLYAVGAFIQSLGQNPGIEEVLRELGGRTHVYVGTGLGAFGTIHDATLSLDRARLSWDRFWAAEERCEPLRRYRAAPEQVREELDGVPPDPADVHDEDERLEALRVWNAYWAEQSPQLREYVDELSRLEDISVGEDVEAGKLKALREKERLRLRLQERWGAPDPPWESVSANLLWNIPNTPASQISMLGRLTGLSFAPVAACATFGVCLKLGMDAIERGDARAVVVGATDPPPHPLTVAAFYRGRVLSADRRVSKPLTGMRGTHVSGGSAVWIIGERSFMEEKGFRPLGMEPVAVGVSSDADHIITPSREGPLDAVREAMGRAGVGPEGMAGWDLHATATPGDFREVENVRSVLPEHVLVTARKGTFGHGMGASGGWELTAQYLGVQRGELYPTPLSRDELNPAIARLHDAFVYDAPVPLSSGIKALGKLSMGVGGVNACVISRPL